MARPQKKGLDYFPMDVDIDDKIELIEAKHGLPGFAILVKLYQRIYKEGYYLEWTPEKELLFGKRNNCQPELIQAVLQDCLIYEIFDRDIFKQQQILTSSGIQKRYLKAKEKSKDIKIHPNFKVFEEEITVPDQGKEVKKPIKGEITPVNSEKTPVNSETSTQRKEKKSKEKESKELKRQKINLRKEEFKKEVLMAGEKYDQKMLEKFILYWTEENRTGTHMRYEFEKTWNLAGRLARWQLNQSEYGPQKKTTARNDNKYL